MPTIESILQKFSDSYEDWGSKKLLLRSEKYSPVYQESFENILNTNVTMVTKKDILNLKISEALRKLWIK